MTALDMFRKAITGAMVRKIDEECLAGKPTPGAIKCEVDGERMPGVCFVSIEIDRDGDVCLKLFTDPVTRLPWYGTDIIELPSQGKTSVGP